MSRFVERPIGIYEKALPDQMDWATRLKAAKQAGFDFVELSIDESDKRLARLDWDGSQRDKLKQLIDDTGVRIPSMCLSGHRRFPLGSEDPKIRNKAREMMAKAIKLADDLGIRVIQLAGYDVYYDESTSRTKKLFRESLEEAVALASRAEVMLALEIMDIEFLGTINRALKYVETIQSPWLKIYPDLGNLSRWTAEPGKELELGCEHIVAIHVKETKPDTFKGVPFGEGTVKFERLFQKLKELNYTGPFLIEMWAKDDREYTTETAIDEIRTARQWVAEKMKAGGLK